MKFYCLLVFIFLLSVDAQRRSVNSELLSENEPQPKSARRGRARFTATSDAPQINEQPRRSDPLSRRLVSRRRPESHTEAIPPRKTYEVAEVVDEVPIEAFRRTSKTKVLTETKYEAQNAPPSNTLFQPSTTENIDDIIRSIGGDILDTTSPSVQSSSTFPSSLEFQPSEITSGEFTKLDNEISRVSETTTPLTTRTTKRSHGRSRNSGVTAAPTVASRVRSRTRATRRPEEQNSVSPSSRVAVNRGSRRRPETVNTETRTNVEQQTRARIFETRTKAPLVAPSAETVEPRARHIEPRSRGPSVIATAETVEAPRFRNGRRIGTAARKVEEPKSTERATVDLPPSRRFNSRKNVDTSTTTIRSRSRFRSRDIPPVIDEQKLEVLPLFERESKTVRPVRKFVSRRRNLNSAEEVETSATENDVKVAPQPPKQSVVVETRTESTIKRRKPTARLLSRTTKPTVPSTRQTVRTYKPTVHTKKPTPHTNKPTVQTKKPTHQTNKPTVQTTRATTSKPKVHTSKPIIKESVISEITEVTSKRTVTRSKSGRNKIELPKTVGRGSKKLEANLPAPKKSKSSLTSSEEDIEESDNYPEPFKALIQAKKHKKESRSPQHLTTASPAVTKSTEKVVISTPSTTTQVISSEANRQLEDFENELKPSKSVRPTPGRRFSPSTEKTPRPTRKTKFSRSTTLAPLPTPEHRFHAKFNNEPEVTSSNPVKSRSFSPKPPRGLYSSRKTKESLTKNKSTTAQIPIPKKSNRYSSRYRNDASSRGAIRTSTNAPAYLPTIPTITPPTTSVKSSVAYQDKDLGVEVISFDDPVNTVPSANLVSGEYLASSTENHLSSPLVSASQTKTTEKPVSIIERIINSITAISTTEVPDLTRQTTSPQEILTKESAILKLATKKSTKLDKTQTTQTIPTVTVTSEKPTTIIERILSSLSAIQADNTTDTKHFKSKQVGTNFNTISFPSTTPITRVTKSTLTAPISTSVNPLFILDEISNDQILQKRTIEKLLALLNTLTTPSPHPTPLVVVTPKTTSYVLGSSAANTANTPATTTTTTTEPTTTTTTTETSTNQLFTSPSPNVSLSSRVQLPAAKYTTTPIYTTLTTQAPTAAPPMSTVSIGETVTTNSVPTSTLQSSTQAPTEVVTASPVSTTTSQTPTLTSTQIPTTTGSNDFSNEIGALPLFVNVGVSSLSPVARTQSTDSLSDTSSGVDSTTTSSFDFSTPFGSTLSPTEYGTDTETNFVFPSTIPAVVNFEVDQNTVPPFEANPLSISSVNNATSTTGSTSSSTVPTVRENPLSISSPSSTTTESSTSTSTSSSSTTAPANSTTPSTATSSTAPTATLPTLTEILNGRTVKAFNSIINISDLSKVQTLDVDPKTNRVLNADELKNKQNVVFRWKPVTTSTYTFYYVKNKTVSTTLPTPTLSNRILDDPVRSTTFSIPTTQQPTTTTTLQPRRTTTPVPSTTTFIPTTTFAPTTTIPPSTVASFIRSRGTTVLPLSQPATSTFRTTTNFPSTTFLPQFLNSIISTLRPRRVTTEAPFTIVTPVSNRIESTASPRVEINTPGDLVSASSTRRTIRTTAEPPTSTILTTLPVSTTTRNTRRRGTAPTTTTPPPTTTILTTTTLATSTAARNARRSTTSTEPTTTTNATKRLRQLTDQQKKDLQTLAQLEMEQAAILKQLAFLTNLNFANTKPTTEKDDLAKRVIALAVERDKNKEKTTTSPPEPEGNRQAKKIAATNPQNIEDLLKQLNIATPSTITSEYGKSDDAIIAALLKEQGIGPTTPKVLEDVYSLTTTTTRRPKTTTRRPGPLMQSLNWLLNVLAPPTTKKPKTKSKPKPKPKPKPKTPDSEELLTHQPTHLTPVVTPPPRQNIVSSLSQQDIQKLIKQLETIQKDPNSSKELDFSSIKSLQSLINTVDGVKVTSSGTTGTTTRETTPLSTSKRRGKSRVVKSTTALPLSVSNSIADDEFVTTTSRPRVTLPPVRLRPVPGIEEDGTMVRGQLISAAVNVTRAISSFLGTALQDAAQQFTRLFANGSSNLRHYLSSSSVLSNLSNVSATS